MNLRINRSLRSGNSFFYFITMQQITRQLGQIFSLDWQKRALDARFGILHRFNENTLTKMRVNQKGFVDILLKHRLSSSLSVGVTSSLNVKSAAVEEPRPLGSLPIGI